MVIDAHNHPFWLGHDPEAMVQDMDERGIDVTWVLSWEIEPDQCEPGYVRSLDPRWSSIPLASVVEACRAFPKRLIPFYAPDPRKPGALDRLRAAAEIHGVRGCGELKLRMCLDSPDALALFRVCGELRLPVTFHLDVPLPPDRPVTGWVWWYGGSLGALERALQSCPDTTFIGHAPGFWRYVSGDGAHRPESYPDGPVTPGGELLRLLDSYPHLFADLSAGSGLNAIQRDPAWGREFVMTYQDRLLFGRDQFDGGHMDALRAMQLPGEAWTKIMGGNALKRVPL